MDQSTQFSTQANRTIGLNFPKTAVIGFLLIIALVAFEMFNFDTTRYALRNLLGDVTFLNLRWATILAVAFCAIDFAGLARLFTPERGSEEPKAVWYLMGAWLLGATMNALMTWWAVSLTLLTHEFGNEVMSRQQLLQIVPVFVAALVWLTRILFIGAFSVAGDYIFVSQTVKKPAPSLRPQGMPLRERPVPVPTPIRPVTPSPVRQGPPIPSVRRSPSPVGMQARSRNR
ncbi:MAG: hypothetical protein H6667_16670 [Ardenticatenaceae bacterium]|nr:hypothetical protein [Ardenticatenaceae bacterium]MCB9446319.1 hypothetical protein [Ardenticatenaceae bacterium]